MRALRAKGIDEAVTSRWQEDRPTLGICLGMQLAVEWSDEDGGVACLGLAPGRVERLKTNCLPRMGWASVDPWNAVFYFAHSYAVKSPEVVATSDGVACALSCGSFFAVQFHPEKSGRAGRDFLRTWFTHA